MRTVCFVSGPYSSSGGCEQNVLRAIDAAEALANFGVIPVIPHLFHYWHLLHPHDYEFWMRLDEELLRRCDCLLRLAGNSPGADREVRLAEKLRLPVFYQLEDVCRFDRLGGRRGMRRRKYDPLSF